MICRSRDFLQIRPIESSRNLNLTDLVKKQVGDVWPWTGEGYNKQTIFPVARPPQQIPPYPGTGVEKTLNIMLRENPVSVKSRWKAQILLLTL